MNNWSQFINSLYTNNGINFQKVENNTLAINKFIKTDFFEKRNSKKDILSAFEEYSHVNCSFIKKSIELIKNSLANHLIVCDKSLIADTPLICGLGAAHVLETALTLHHIWGVPYIPGSSLKGVCRQVAFWELVEGKSIPENELENFQKKFYGELAIDNEEILVYQLLFGAQDFKGLLLFLDAYPECNNEKIFKLDIMNPHYSKYYGDSTGETPPGDWENPTPIFFLTVKEGVKFRFVVLFDNWRWEKIKVNITTNVADKIDMIAKGKENKKLFELILKQALSYYGVGSKTRLGYGSFKV